MRRLCWGCQWRSSFTTLAGQPRSFTLRTGNPNIDYWNLQAGIYLQDDIRVRKNLTLSPGFRYEAQTHLSDYNNFGPRFGITWAPGKSGKTTLRASAGVFYDWLSSNIYEQTIRVDGFRQRELNVFNPPYPVVDPAVLGVAAPTNKYLLSDGLQMQRNTRVSAGIDRALTRMLRVNATYQHVVGQHLMRGQNLNAPVDGIRPDPAFSNLVEVLGDARLRQDNVNIGGILNFNVPKNGPAPAGGPIMINGGAMVFTSGGPPPPPPPPGTRATPANARWNWRRMSLLTNMVFGRAFNNTDGAFNMPASGNIRDDWGPASNDIRHRFILGWSSQQLRNFNANMNFNTSGGTPYTIRAGTDLNGDLVFTDRPEGVGRNSARGTAQWSLNGFFTYFWQFGKPVAMPGGITLRSDGGALAAAQTAGQNAGRYRLSLNVNVQNLTNHPNYAGFIGTILSSHFGRPQTVLGTRKIDIGMGISF